MFRPRISKDFAGQTGRGLGRNTAVSIARHSGDVILTYRSGAGDAKAVMAEIEALGCKSVALHHDEANPLATMHPTAQCAAQRRRLGAQPRRERRRLPPPGIWWSWSADPR